MGYAEKEDKACAYCKRYAKSGCTASRTASTPTPPSLEDRVARLEASQLEQRLSELEQTVGGFQGLLERFAEEFKKAGDDIAQLWNAVWPQRRTEPLADVERDAGL